MWRAVVLLGLAGCASAPTPKLSAEAAFGPTAARPVVDPHTSPRFELALERFQTEASAVRHATPAGAPMPEVHASAWSGLLDEVDALLTGPAKRTSLLELARARMALETELAWDQGAFGDVPPALAERIPRTTARLTTALTRLAALPHRGANPATFLWPVEPVVLTSPWGTRVHPLHGDLRFHAGVDLQAELSQPVRAAAGGTVVFSGWNGAHGKQLELQHDGHVATRYSHLQALLVPAGAHVKRGEIIGLAGETGEVTGPHLHFELVKDGHSVDPEALLPAPPADATLFSRHVGRP